MPWFEPSPGKKHFVEFDTDVGGVVEMVAGLARIDMRDCLRIPELRADLFRRCDASLRRGKILGVGGDLVDPYRWENEDPDTWSAFRVLAERYKGKTIVQDCEEFGPEWAVRFKLKNPRRRVGVAVTQPRIDPATGQGRGMAHCWTWLDGNIFDGAVLAGMTEPADKAKFYQRGEVAIVEI